MKSQISPWPIELNRCRFVVSPDQLKFVAAANGLEVAPVRVLVKSCLGNQTKLILMQTKIWLLTIHFDIYKKIGTSTEAGRTVINDRHLKRQVLYRDKHVDLPCGLAQGVGMASNSFRLDCDLAEKKQAFMNVIY